MGRKNNWDDYFKIALRQFLTKFNFVEDIDVEKSFVPTQRRSDIFVKTKNIPSDSFYHFLNPCEIVEFKGPTDKNLNRNLYYQYLGTSYFALASGEIEGRLGLAIICTRRPKKFFSNYADRFVQKRKGIYYDPLMKDFDVYVVVIKELCLTAETAWLFLFIQDQRLVELWQYIKQSNDTDLAKNFYGLYPHMEEVKDMKALDYGENIRIILGHGEDILGKEELARMITDYIGKDEIVKFIGKDEIVKSIGKDEIVESVGVDEIMNVIENNENFLSQIDETMVEDFLRKIKEAKQKNQQEN